MESIMIIEDHPPLLIEGRDIDVYVARFFDQIRVDPCAGYYPDYQQEHGHPPFLLNDVDVSTVPAYWEEGELPTEEQYLSDTNVAQLMALNPLRRFWFSAKGSHSRKGGVNYVEFFYATCPSPLNIFTVGTPEAGGVVFTYRTIFGTDFKYEGYVRAESLAQAKELFLDSVSFETVEEWVRSDVEDEAISRELRHM